MATLQPITQLEYLYPDIEGELCSRHSSTLSRLKQVFVDLYSYEPTHCAIANGIVCLTPKNGFGMEVTFALENGVMIYFRRTEHKQDLFINSNRYENELILNNKGEIKFGKQSFLADQMSQVFRQATEDLSFEKTYGGILYIHSNIPEGCFQQQQSWLTAFYLVITHMNELLSDMPLKELVKKMTQTNLMGSKNQIQNRVYNYLNRKLCIRVNDKVATVEVPRDVQLLFYSLKSQFYHKPTHPFIQPQEIAALMEQHLKTNDLIEILSNFSTYDLAKFPQKYQDLLFASAKIYEYMSTCTTPETFNRLLEEILNLNRICSSSEEEENVYTCGQVKQLVENLKVDSYLLIQNTEKNKSHIVFSVSRKRYTDVIHKLRQSVSPKKNARKDILGNNRWDNKVPTNEEIFSGVPSRGIGVIDPSECMWFRD